MPHRLPPRGPSELVMVLFGLMFWLSVLIFVPTFIEWTTRSW